MRTIILLAIATALAHCEIAIIKDRLEDCGSCRQADQNSRSPKPIKLKQDTLRGSRIKRQVLRDIFGINTTWKDGVFYTFNTSSRIVQNLFKNAAKVWSDNSCINFLEDKNAKDKVVVIKEDGCFSNIGRLGGDQLLALDEKAEEASAVHEIGHILGFFHTMSRNDRDQYITIVMKNVDPRHIKEFSKVSSIYSNVFGLTYDYGSIMHYNEISGSINKLPTMVATDPHHQKTMGSATISFTDILMINEHYGCREICNKTTSAKCENEGFPHPRNCSICICPSGYGGDLCDQRPQGCGENLKATSEKQTVDRSLGYGSGLRQKFDFCNYMISAPRGKKIEVAVLSITDGYEMGGCRMQGVEIKAEEDQKLTGYRYCSMNGTKYPITSISNPLPVILFNRIGIMKVKFTYRYTN